MKKALGYITSAKYGDIKLPKEYFDSYVSSEQSKYITFRDTFKFKNYFKEHGNLPELVLENEVEPVCKEDIYKLGKVNIFDRKKFEANIQYKFTLTELKELGL